MRKTFTKSFVWSITTYCLRNLDLVEERKGKNKGFEISCWRQTLRTLWPGKVTNHVVLNRMEEKCSCVIHLMQHLLWCVSPIEGKVEGKRSRVQLRAEIRESIKQDRPYNLIKELAVEKKSLGEDHATHQPLA